MTGYLSDIWRLRHFWLALVRIDLRNRYRRSIIGIGWSLLQPIAMTIVLCAFFSQLLGPEIKQYAPYLLSGLTFWGFIIAVVMQGCQCFFQGESYIRQHPAPLAIYPLRTALSAGFHFLLGLLIVIVFVAFVLGLGKPLALLSLAPTLVLLFVIGWSLAVCTGVANVMFQDSQHLLEVVMQILFYATPIMWRPSMMPKNAYIERFVQFNPLASLLELIRNPVLEGRFPSSWAVGMGLLAGLVAVGAAALALRCFEKRMIFYL